MTRAARPLVHSIASLSLAAILSGHACASDWPRFRGPNGTGVSADRNVPVEIGENTNRLWKVEIPGGGNSSPVVVAGRIYLQSATEDGGRRMLLALDLADGRVIWEQSAPGALAKTHAKNTLASASAACDGERVVIPFWDGQELTMAAYTVAGAPLWKTPLGPFASQHGAGHSPILVGNLVVLANDQDGRSEIVALDAEDGHVVWKKERPAFKACSYSTPLLLEQPGEETLVLAVSTAGVTGYDLVSGSERWKWSWTTNDKGLRTVGSPIVSQGLVFFTGGNGPGDRHAVAVRLGSRRGELEPQLEWETRKLFPYVPGLLAHGDHLYFVNDKGIAACFEARTMKSVWEERLGCGDVTSSPLLVDGRVYVVSETGQALVFEAATRFKLLSTGQLDEGVKATPAVADSRLLVRGKQHLYCFGVR